MATKDTSGGARTSEVLRGARQRLDAHMVNSPLAIVEFDPGFHIIRWSGAAERVFGWSESDVLGKGIEDLRWVYEEDLESVRQVSQEMLAGHSPHNLHVNRNYRKDGSLIHCEWYNSTLYDKRGRLSSVFSLILDISKRKRAEEELRRTHERLVLAQQSAGAGTWDWDIPSGRLEWSPELFHLFGLDPAKVVASFDIWRGVLHVHDRRQAEERVNSALRDRVRLHNEYRVVLPTGDVRWISALGDAKCDDSGRPVRMSGICLDITARKEAEEAVRGMAAELEQRVRERTIELQGANTALRQEIAQRRDLERQILEISEREQHRIGCDLHDSLGQRLTALKFMSSALGKRLTRGRSSGAASAVRINHELEKAVAEVRDLARGLQAVQPDAEGLMSALRVLADSVTQLSKVACRFECPRAVEVTDYQVATHLYRIAQEAVGNAVRHSRARHIWIRLQRVGGRVRLSVEDDGCGLPAKSKRSNGLGLRIMTYRAAVSEAGLTIGRRPGGGTRMVCAWTPKDSKEQNVR